jgi:hypothetical protein
MDAVTKIDQIESPTIGCLRSGAQTPKSISLPIESFIAPVLVGRRGSDVNGAIQLIGMRDVHADVGDAASVRVASRIVRPSGQVVAICFAGGIVSSATAFCDRTDDFLT